MKTKLFLLFILLMITFGSCNTPSYLPKVKDVRLNNYGAQIVIIPRSGASITGELLAVNEDKIILINDIYPNNIVEVTEDQIRRYYIRYARPHHWGWLLLLCSFSLYNNDGIAFYLAATLSTSVAVAGESAHTYKGKNLTFDKLKMFARFPQGIPTDFDQNKYKWVMK